jgi:hypothetical protein
MFLFIYFYFVIFLDKIWIFFEFFFSMVKLTIFFSPFFLGLGFKELFVKFSISQDWEGKNKIK